jgi:hypothetical protein
VRGAVPGFSSGVVGDGDAKTAKYFEWYCCLGQTISLHKGDACLWQRRRNEAKATSDIDIAFEYVANLVSGGMATCYENVNADWETLADRLKAKFGHQPKQTGLSPYADPYDSKAWAAIRVGREIGRSGKVILTWTAPKPDRS